MSRIPIRVKSLFRFQNSSTPSFPFKKRKKEKPSSVPKNIIKSPKNIIKSKETLINNPVSRDPYFAQIESIPGNLGNPQLVERGPDDPYEKCSFNGALLCKKNGRYSLIVDSLENTELLNFYRYSDDPLSHTTMAVKLLNKNGKFLGYHRDIVEGCEDGRVFVFQDRLFMAVSVLYRGKPGESNHVTKIGVYEMDPFYNLIGFRYPQFGNNVPSSTVWEKNWSYFEHQGELLFIYSIHPFVIGKEDNIMVYKQEWNWIPDEHIRGGTLPILVGDYYYFFAHTKNHHDGHYRIVIMMMDKNFKLVKRSDKLKTLSQYLVVFPVGCIFVLNEKKFYLCIGVNDREQYLVSFSLENVQSLLIHNI